MLGKFGIYITILILVFLFYLVIALGAGGFSKKEGRPEVKKYLRSVNILLIFIIIVATILILFL
jgi:Mn2+/Fe2+ NRAMP family transporter|tara:strand:- start:212 stop:403 length:192 start_codon:yes stop_codon:yes gene_type:complete